MQWPEHLSSTGTSVAKGGVAHRPNRQPAGSSSDRQTHDPASSTAFGLHSVLQMQKLAGNTAVSAMLSQRGRTDEGPGADGTSLHVQRCGGTNCAGCSCGGNATESSAGQTDTTAEESDVQVVQRSVLDGLPDLTAVQPGSVAQIVRLTIQRGLDPATEKSWDWYDKESHRKDASFLETVGAAKGAAGDVAKAIAATGVPKTDKEREKFENQVITLIRLNAVALVGDHRAGLVKRKSQFESMLTPAASGTPPPSTAGPEAPASANTAAADTAAAVRGAAEVVRKLNAEQEQLVKLRDSASSAVRLNDGPDTIPAEYEALTAAAQPRSTPATMQSVLTAKDRMDGLSWGTKKLRLLDLGNELAALRGRQISGVQQALASVYDAFPVFAMMPATFPSTGKKQESSTARKVAAGIGVATLLATPFAPLALWLAKDEFSKDKPPDDNTLLAEVRQSFEKLLNNTDDAIVKIGSGGMDPLDLPGAVTSTRNALPEPLRAELDRVKQEHEVAKFTEEMIMALGIAVLTGLSGGAAGLGFAALAATTGGAAAVVGVAQVADQTKGALDRQTIASASTSPDKSLLGVSAPSTFEWAMLGVTAALTAFDLAMIVKEIAALKPHFNQEPHVGGSPKESAGGSGTQGEPGSPKAGGDPAAPKQPGAAAAGSAEARVLEAGRGDAVPSLEQIDSELAIVERSKSRPSKVEGYQDEVELGNGHTWRRDANDNWCRFSDNRICVPGGKGKVKVSDGVVRSEQDLDALVAGSRPRLDAPPTSVTSPEDVRLWELYNSYFDERVASMRADLRSESGATKREPPLTLDAFKDRYTKNPKLIQALRGRLSQGETGNILADITSGRVAQNLGVSKVPNPARGDMVYPDFVFKRAMGDGFSAVSQKRRDFAPMTKEDLRKTVMDDIREGLDKYYGDRYVRRPGLDETGQKIRIDELVLNYDLRTVPEPMRPQIREIAAAYEGVDVKIGFFEL